MSIPKLPLKPVYFIILYLLFATGPALYGFLGDNVVVFVLGVLFVAGAFGIQALWVYQSAVISDFSISRSTKSSVLPVYARRVRNLIFSGAMSIIFAVLTSLLRNAGTFFETISRIAPPALMLVSVILFLGSLWIAAQAICQGEAETKAPSHSVVGTFLLFVYLLIGAPFIYSRLKRLRGAISGAVS